MPRDELTVVCGSVRLRIYRMRCGRWRCRYRPPGESAWQSISSSDPAKLTAKVKALAGEMAAARAETRHIPESEYREFREWLEERKRRPAAKTLEDVTEEFLAAQKSAVNLSSRHFHGLEADVARMATEIGQDRPIREITPAELDRWLQARKIGTRRRYNLRAIAVQVWRFARERDYLPDERTAAERTTRLAKPHAEIGILTPAEMETVLREVREDWLPWAVLGAFAGLRSEEIRPDSRSYKRAIHWEDIREGYIDVPPETAKQTRRRTGTRRLVPIQPVLSAWLEALGAARRTGPVCPKATRPGAHETTRLGKLLGRAWPRNCLRHSYGTYRCALTADAPRVAREMGNTPSIVAAHYDRVALPETAREWFSLGPEGVAEKKIAHHA